MVVPLSAFLRFIFVLFFRSFKALPVARRSGFAKPRASKLPFMSRQKLGSRSLDTWRMKTNIASLDRVLFEL